jgi:hypothetical protein
MVIGTRPQPGTPQHSPSFVLALLNGPGQRTPSGPAVISAALTGRKDDRTRPIVRRLNFTLAEQGPSKDDYVVSLDGLPLSSWRSRGEPGPQRILPLPGEECTIKARDDTSNEGRSRIVEMSPSPLDFLKSANVRNDVHTFDLRGRSIGDGATR